MHPKARPYLPLLFSSKWEVALEYILNTKGVRDLYVKSARVKVKKHYLYLKKLKTTQKRHTHPKVSAHPKVSESYT